MLRRFICRLLGATVFLGGFATQAAGTNQLWLVGTAKVDITPDYPVRLAGYAARKTESEGVVQHLYAKALAFGSDQDKPALLITVDNCGVPANVRDELVGRLEKERHLESARIAVCSTHTHSGPWLRGYLPNLFADPLPADQAARLERYTRELTDALESVALKALDDRRPAQLSRGNGQAAFAANRRTKDGPADHDLPALFVTAPDGGLRAILTSYACHCTTVTGEFNQICGDWAGYAAEYLERDYPGAIVLVALGCAGDANPNPRPGFELAKQHGQQINAAVHEILACARQPVAGTLACRAQTIDLPLAGLPTRAEWETQAQQTNYLGKYARLNLGRLARGETLPTKVSYLIQTWAFGDGLAIVFLPGEVVVDYSLRLKREFDASRLWVNAYANDVPCYIPSERVLKEGGYEAGGAMVYYDKPAPFAPGLEARIVSAVHALVPPSFAQAPKPKVELGPEAQASPAPTPAAAPRQHATTP
jgi:hypothetical protein